MGRKILTWLVIAFIVYYVLHEPKHAADLVHNVVHAFETAVNRILQFFDSLS